MDLQDEKLIPRSRLLLLTKTSRPYLERTIKGLTDRGLINPESTRTGREYLSFREAMIVWERLK